MLIYSGITSNINLPLHLMAKHLMRVFAGVGSGAVDIFNIVTRSWSTAQLSIPRFSLAAASVGNLAIFAGGQDKNAGIVLLKIERGRDARVVSARVEQLSPNEYTCNISISHARICRCCCGRRRHLQHCHKSLVYGSAQHTSL